MSARSLAVFLAVLAVIGLLGYGLLNEADDALSVGDEMPDTELSRLEGSGTGSISDYRGKYVLVNVWASWCPPCEEELPALQRYYEAHRSPRFEMLGVNSQDLTTDALDDVREYGLTYAQLRDGSGDYKDDVTLGIPESILVDPKGRVRHVLRGQVTTQVLERQVTPLLDDA